MVNIFKVLATIVCAFIAFSVVHRVQEEQVRNKEVTSTWSGLYEHLSERDVPVPCHSSVVEACRPLGEVKSLIRRAPTPEAKSLYISYLHAIRAYRKGQLSEAGLHFLSMTRNARAPYVEARKGFPAGNPEFQNLQGGSTHSAVHTFDTTNHQHLQHNIAQLEYLIEKGLLRRTAEQHVDAYKSVLSVLEMLVPDPKALIDPNTGIPYAKYLVTDPEFKPLHKHFAKLSTVHGRLLHLANVPRLAGPAVNPRLPAAKIQREFYRNKPGFTYVDELLVPEALRGLQKLCMESTFWFDHKFGYVGSYMLDGFYSELLFQVSNELSERFPLVFLGRQMTGMWAYSYDSEYAKGIRLHADSGFANVNFWITPDDANLDPNSGGLIVYPKGVPVEWTSKQWQNPAVLEKFVEEAGVKSIRVPYRQNRMVFFNSNMVHATDEIKFKSGYANRRINITMLFGHRESDEAHLPPASLEKTET